MRDRAPVRPLDSFEAGALARIRSGKNLAVEGRSKELRMLGAIRSANRFAECLGGDRGDLSGAFSYVLE